MREENAKKNKKKKKKSKSNSSNSDPSNDIKVPKKYSYHAKEYYQYALVGIIIHTGTAQAGHYYSYIKQRKLLYPDEFPDEKQFGQLHDVWYEFNDNIIRPFDMANLEESCFGGTQQIVERNAWGLTVSRKAERYVCVLFMRHEIYDGSVY